VVGIATDGDFWRAIWNSVSLKEPVASIVNRKFVSLEEHCNIHTAKKKFSTTEIAHIPILKDGKLVNILFKKNMDGAESKPLNAKLHIPAIVMAGGYGTRLDPFTRILPKPLIPIGEKPVTEIMMDKLAEHGTRYFLFPSTISPR